MKLLDYVFSLNVTIDYNKEDQRNSTPEQRDEYDDVHLETLSFEPFAEEDNLKPGMMAVNNVISSECYNRFVDDYRLIE